MRSITDPEHREHVAGVWGVDPDEMPGPGLTAHEIMEAIHRGEIKALFSMCFNPLVSLPDANFTREALEKLEFFGVIDFFLSETAHHADVCSAGSLQEEDEGVVCSAEGRVQKINKAVDPPGEARADALIICDLAKRLGRGRYSSVPSARARSSRSCASHRRGHRGLLRDHLGAHRRRSSACSGRAPRSAIPARRASSRTRRFYHPDGKAHFQVTEWRESGDPVDASFPLLLTTGRVVSHYLSGTQTRRIGPLVEQYPEPSAWRCIRAWPEARHPVGDWAKVTTRRASVVAQVMVVKTIRPDTVFIPYHWPGGDPPTC